MENIDKIDRVERIYLTWITNGAIFLATAPIIRNIGKKGKLYALLFFTIALVFFLVISVDYIEERNKLRDEGVDIPLRLDLLFTIMFITIFVILIISLDYEKNGVNISNKVVDKLFNIFKENRDKIFGPN